MDLNAATHTVNANTQVGFPIQLSKVNEQTITTVTKAVQADIQSIRFAFFGW